MPQPSVPPRLPWSSLPLLLLLLCRCAAHTDAPAAAAAASGVGGGGTIPRPKRPPSPRGGAAYGEGGGAPPPSGEDRGGQVRDLIRDLSGIVNGGGGGGDGGGGGRDGVDEAGEARLWRRLGKLLLDGGECAESSRVFRYGSGRCPSDEGLRHHVRVYEAFHGDDGGVGECDGAEGDLGGDGDPSAPPPPPQGGADLLRRRPDLLLTLDVPPSAVPRPVLDEAQAAAGGTAVPASALAKIVHASTEPVFSGGACRYLIDSARRAAERRGGYTTDRHVHAPTCDVPTFELDGAARGWVRRAVIGTLFPLIASAFPAEMGVTEDVLRVQDSFVVRYDGDGEGGEDTEGGSGGGGRGGPGFSSLRPHEDESLVSLTVALNDMFEYGGGGLFVAATGDLLNGDAGTVLCFAGALVHGGYPVERGTRWIMTAFLNVDKNRSGRAPGYVMEEILGRGDADGNTGSLESG